MRAIFSLFAILIGFSLAGCFDDDSTAMTTKEVAQRISLLPIFDDYTERKTKSDVSSEVILELKKGKEIFQIDVSQLSISGETSLQAYKRTVNAKPPWSTLVIEKDDFGLGDKSALTSLFGGSYKTGDNKAPKYYQLHVFQEPFDIEIMRMDYRQVDPKLRRARYKSNTALMRLVARQMDSLKFLKVGKTQNNSVNPEAKTKKTPGGAPAPLAITNLNDIPEFRDFRGLDDKRVSRDLWEDWLAEQIRRVATTVSNFPGVNNEIKIPGETQQDYDKGISEGYVKSGKTGPFVLILAMDDVAADHRKDNPYAAVTEPTEQKLKQKILNASDDSLTPSDVMQFALEASNGSYPLAVLTATAILKQGAKKGRTDALGYMFIARNTGKIQNALRHASRLKPYSDLAKKLRNLRPKGDRTGDKLGPWYHGFAILAAGALSSWADAKVGLEGEHAMKRLKGFFQGEGAYNVEKHTTDQYFGGLNWTLSKYRRDPPKFEPVSTP